jgi:hypothetical protein
MVQSEISRAYVSEMENELEKNPRGAAQAVRAVIFKFIRVCLWFKAA